MGAQRSHSTQATGYDRDMRLSNATATLDRPRRWRAAPVIRASFALHAAGILVLLVYPTSWLLVLGAIVANHMFLSAAALAPRGQLLGPNITRLPPCAADRGEIALTFDDGPDPATTLQILDLLDAHRAKASFFCIGEKVRAFPAVVQEIVRRGHSVENHSERHPHGFSFYGIASQRREVSAAQTAITAIAGRAPMFFRAPAGFRSPMLDFVLAGAGLRYVSWTRRGLDGVRSNPDAVLRRVTQGLAAGDILLLHDSSCNGEAVVLKVLPALLQQLAARGLKSVSLPAAFH